jgi:hypothetical protein
MGAAHSGKHGGMDMSNFVETWKGIATALGRSERWCRYMARRAADPLPVFKVGGIVRLNSNDLEDWLGRQRATSIRGPVAPEPMADVALRLIA